MTKMDINSSFARTLVEEFVRAGVREAIVSPGSRSAPLALAIANEPRMRMRMVVDERSAGFLALGIGKVSQVPALLVCTSGTAAAHYHPAVLEASHAAVPMIVVTADRPPELIGVGAPQTIVQTNLFGGAVRFFGEPGPPEDHSVGADGARGWRALAGAAFEHAVGRHPGPVHLNLGFREPLIPSGDAIVLEAPRSGAAGAYEREVPEPGCVELTPRTIVIAGDGAADSVLGGLDGVPIFADPLSGMRGLSNAVTSFEAVQRSGIDKDLMPDQVLRLGGLPASSKLSAITGAAVPQVGVTSRGRQLDPTRTVTRWVEGPVRCVGEVDRAWAERWFEVERTARAAIDDELAQRGLLDGSVLASLLPSMLSSETIVTLNSSLSIREWEWVMPRSTTRVLANRGVNGIDGFVASSCGVAIGAGAPIVGVTGDLGFLHDLGSLVTLATVPMPPVKIIVNDNDGGGIFELLPPRELGEFEKVFGTPHGRDLSRIASGCGVEVRTLPSRVELEAFLAQDLPGLSVGVMHTDRGMTRTRTEAMFQAARTRLAKD